MYKGKILLLLLLIITIPIMISAGEVSLAWDASTSPDITGYKIYYGRSSRSYDRVNVLGDVTTHTVTGLYGGYTWFLTATAYKLGGESAFSNEVSLFIPAVNFYSSTTGDDTGGNSCQNIASPCNFSNGLAYELSKVTVANADTINVCAGACNGSGSATLNLTIDEAGSYSGLIPSGTSFANALTIQVYTGETITFQPVDAEIGLRLTTGCQYVIWKGFILDGSLAYDGDECPSCWGTGIGVGSGNDAGGGYQRFDGIEVKNWSLNGIIVAGAEGNNEFLNIHSHNNGRTAHDEAPYGGHGIYISTGHNLLDGGEYDHNDTNTEGKRDNWGIQVYSYSYASRVHNNIVRNAKVHDNPKGMVLSGGTSNVDGNVAYNNLVYDNEDVGINPYGVGYQKVFNNTVTGTSAGCGITSSSSTGEVRNNIVWGNLTDEICVDGGSPPIKSNNLCLSGCTYSGDPLFVDGASHDFHLTYSSPARDTGMTLLDVTTDFDGVTRPRGEAYDIGAFEYSLIPSPPTLMMMGVGR